MGRERQYGPHPRRTNACNHNHNHTDNDPTMTIVMITIVKMTIIMITMDLMEIIMMTLKFCFYVLILKLKISSSGCFHLHGTNCLNAHISL